MKVKVNLSNQTLEYMDSQPYIQGTDTRNKLCVYIEHSSVPQTEGAFNIMIAYALQNGRTTIKMANTGATQETIDGVLYDIFYFTAPKVLTSISGNFVATLILKVNSNTYKVNVLNTVLNAVEFEAFEDALDDTASEVLESLENMTEDITYLQSQVVGVLHNTDIVDNDDSDDPTKVLSARMGKVLAERIGATTSGLVNATYNESTGILTLTYDNDDTYEMKIGLSTTDKSNMADDVENVILADLFETFSTVKSYSTGDFVNYENNIYEFVSDKTSGAWDSTKVVIANLNDYMDEVNTSLANMTETIQGLGNLQPSGTDTSVNILDFNEDKGIYIGTDNGHWYYWNGTQYVDGGVYQALVGYSLLTSGNIDSFYNNARYWLANVYTYTGTFPETLNGFALLDVYKLNNDVTIQYYYEYNTNGLYFRRSSQGTWLDWIKINDKTIDNNSINTAMLQDNSVITNKINNGAITTPKIADNSITGNKVAKRFNTLLNGLKLTDFNANSRLKLNGPSSAFTGYEGYVYDDYFTFKGPINDNFVSLENISVDTSKTYVAEVYCDGANFTLYLVQNGVYTQATRHNKGYARIEFTPSVDTITFRFDNDEADTFANFYNFKLYEKDVYKGDIDTNDKYDYTGNKRINFTIDLNGTNIPCYIYLPATYSKYGTPSEVIMICHGSGQLITDNDTNNINIINAFVNAGYVVFDCNGNSAITAQAWGCPNNQEAYLKAYEYVQNHFNVKKQINVYGLSMGGLSALNFVNWFPSLVKSLALGSPVIDLYNQGWLYTGGDRKTVIATAYGMAGTSTYEVDKTYGCDPMTRKFKDYDGTIRYPKMPPIKIWHGTADTAVDYQTSVDFVGYLNNDGNYASIHLIEGAGHEVCYGGVASVITELVAWMNRWSYSE